MADATLFDFIGVSIFFASWIGYTLYADNHTSTPTLITIMHNHRIAWMQRLLERDNRIVDTQILGLTMRNVALFASISVLILGGSLAILGSLEKVRGLASDLSFIQQTSKAMWEIKILVLATIFIHAFFKFAWSLRQFNYTATLLGAAPLLATEEEYKDIPESLASLGSLAVRSYNQGIRTYYFGLAALTWFLHPLLMGFAGVWIVLVMYRREFRSRTLKVLLQAERARKGDIQEKL